MDETKQILIALSRLEENVKNMNTKIDGFGKISELALETNQSVKSAHNRIDDLKKDFEEKLRSQKEDYEEKIRVEKEAREKAEGNITWLWRAFGGSAITFVFSIVLMVINFFVKIK